MKESIKNLEYEFSDVERELIEEFCKTESFIDCTPNSVKSEMILRKGAQKVRLCIVAVPGDKRKIDIYTNEVYLTATNPSELNQILDKLV